MPTTPSPPPAPLRLLLPRIRPHARTLALATAFLIVSAGIGLAFPQVVRYLLDAAFLESDRSALNRIALALGALFLVQSALNFGQAYLLSATGERVVAGLRNDLFSHLIEMPAAFFADRRTGELTSRLAADVGTLQTVMSHQISEFLRQLLFLVGGVVLLTLTHPILTATTLAVVPLVVGTAWVCGRRLRRASTAVQDQIAEATAVAEEAFSQIRTVQSFTRESGENARYGERIAAAVRLALRRAVIRGAFLAAITLATFGGITVVLWQGGRLVLEGALTAGTLVSFLLYTIIVAAAVGTLASLYSGYQEAVGAARRVFELLALPHELANPVPTERVALPRPVRGAITYHDVAFRYAPESPWTLRDIQLDVAPGEIVALVGPSGAGKTTLVSLLPRFWDVTEGSITVDGIDVRRLGLHDLRSAIGMVPQEPALFSSSIRYNIAYGRPGASAGEIESAARAAHAHEFIVSLPQGYDTLVGERGIKLSGGQRQRIAIARALLKDPAILVLDEATSSLDTESERLIEQALETLLLNRTTLIIAHRLSTVRRADRLIVLDAGAIVESGSHEELLRGDALYARLY